MLFYHNPNLSGEAKKAATNRFFASTDYNEAPKTYNITTWALSEQLFKQQLYKGDDHCTKKTLGKETHRKPAQCAQQQKAAAPGKKHAAMAPASPKQLQSHIADATQNEQENLLPKTQINHLVIFFSKKIRKMQTFLLTKRYLVDIITKLISGFPELLTKWRRNSVGRVAGSYPVCHLFESGRRYQARWSSG